MQIIDNGEQLIVNLGQSTAPLTFNLLDFGICADQTVPILIS